MGKLKISFVYSLILVFGLIFSSSTLKAQSAEEAINLLENEKFDQATSTIKGAIQKNPNEGSNYFYAGYIYLKTDKPDSAKFYFDKGVSVDEKAPLSTVGQAWIALNNNNVQQAQQLFDKALDVSKGKDQEVYNRIAEALIYADNKDPNKAITYLQKALDVKKTKGKDKALLDAQSHILMGDAYLAAKDGGKAISSYERAISVNPKIAPQAYTKIGKIYLIPRNYEAAETEFQKAVQADANYAPVYKELGELYFTKRDVNKAKEMYNKYMELSDVKSGSIGRVGIFEYLRRDYPAAVNAFKQALQSEPDNIVYNRLLGYSLNKAGDSLAAKEVLDKYFGLVKPEKTLATDYVNYAEVLMKLDQDSLGVKNYLIAVEKDTANIGLVEEVAEELRKNRKNIAAAQLYDILLEKKENPTINDYYRAGTVYVQAKQFDKADSAYAKVIEATPDNYLGYSALALSKFYQESEGGEPGLAKPHYEKLISILEADPGLSTEKNKKSALLTAYQYMASYYTQKEDLKTAGEYWQKVDKVDPGNENAKKFKEYLDQLEKYKQAQQKAQKQKAGK